MDTFDTFKEERIIANKIRQEFDKNHGKYLSTSRRISKLEERCCFRRFIIQIVTALNETCA